MATASNANSANPRRGLAIFVWLVLCGIWGSTWLFIKLGLRDLPPFSFASVRFIVAFTLLACVASVRRARLPRTRAEWDLLAKTGVLSFAINYSLVFWSEKYISSGLAAILQATIPLFGLLIAHKHLPSERLTLARMGGVLIGLFGVAVIFSNQISLGDKFAFYGSVGIVIGAFAAAYANVLVKARAARFDLSVLIAGQMLCGLVPLIVFSLIKEGSPINLHWTKTAVIAILYLALVGTVAAFLLYYWLVRNMAVTNTMLISLVTPVVAVLLGVALLDEKLTWRIAVGGLGILIGIGMIVRRRGRQRSEASAPPEIEAA